MSVTLQDVAEKASVSPGTVSRVVNNLDCVRPETRARVLAVMEELGYRVAPPVSRPGLVIKMLGCLQAIHSDQGLMALTRGIDKVSRQELAHLLVHSIPQEFDPAYAPEKVIGRDVDGLIFLANVPRAYHEYAEEKNIPRVRVQTLEIEAALKTTFIAPDNVAMLSCLIQYLAGLGHRRIAFIGFQPELLPVARERRNGYVAGLLEAGLSFEPEYCRYSDDPHRRTDCVGRIVEELLSLENPPTAIVGGTDWVAEDALRACLVKGLRVPEDISIAGIDNCRNHPGLTSIGHDTTKAGQIAALELLNAIRQRDDYIPRKIVLPFELFIRDTTGAAPRDGAERG